MKCLFVLFLVLLSVVGFSSANPVVEYRIVGDVVYGKINLHEPVVSLRLPSDAYNLEVNSDYRLEKVGSYLIIYTNATVVSFFSEVQVEEAKNSFFFIAKGLLIDGSEVSLYLPEGAVIDDNLFLYPKNYILDTNGYNIIIRWQSVDDDILVSYKFVDKVGSWLYFLFGSLLGLFLIVFFLEFRKSKRKFTQNIFGDEKRVIDFLVKQKGCAAWTKEIVREIGISKVKLSRKLRSLEEKGLIKRNPHGNENRVILNK